MENGDEERWASYSSRAAALPYDDFQQVHPAEWAAYMGLFDELVDALEMAEDLDVSWLTTATGILRRADGTGALGLRHALASVARDYALSPREAKLVHQAAGHLDVEPDFGLTRDDPVGVVRDIVMSIVRVHVDYRRALPSQSA